MSELLVIRLKGAPDPTTDLSNTEVEWLFIEGLSGRRGSVHVGSLAEIAPQSVGRKVIVLVPARIFCWPSPSCRSKVASRLPK